MCQWGFLNWYALGDSNPCRRRERAVSWTRLDEERTIYVYFWLGWEDLNPRMTESESVALPLGYTPRAALILMTIQTQVKQNYAWRDKNI